MVGDGPTHGMGSQVSTFFFSLLAYLVRRIFLSPWRDLLCDLLRIANSESRCTYPLNSFRPPGLIPALPLSFSLVISLLLL